MSSNPIKIAIIGGSGMADALAREPGPTHFPDTPFGKPSGPITQTDWFGTPVFLLKRHGDGHRFSPSKVPYRANIFALKSLGVTHIVASGACGSLREHIAPGDLALCTQIIDKTYKRDNTFYEHAAVHVELSEPVCPVTHGWLLGAVPRLLQEEPGTRIHTEATYVAMEGPAFSTRAESLMHRVWGADLVGMTAMPEARLAREAEIAYALVNLPTDYDAWRPHDRSKGQHELLKEIIGNLHACSRKAMALIRAALHDVSPLRKSASPAHSALALGIWTHKPSIPREEVDRLAPLWGKYFADADKA